MSPRFGVLILAGGEATRLPGKLALDAGGLPMLARVYRNFATDGEGEPLEIVLSTQATLVRELDAYLPIAAVVDRYARRGPLGGMLSSLPFMRARYVFAVAGDMPFVDLAFARHVADAYVAGDEAVVPLSRDANGASYREPLCALYDRVAFVREGRAVMRTGRGSLGAVLARMRVREIAPATTVRTTRNVNTASDYIDAMATFRGTRIAER